MSLWDSRSPAPPAPTSTRPWRTSSTRCRACSWLKPADAGRALLLSRQPASIPASLVRRRCSRTTSCRPSSHPGSVASPSCCMTSNTGTSRQTFRLGSAPGSLRRRVSQCAGQTRSSPSPSSLPTMPRAASAPASRAGPWSFRTQSHGSDSATAPSPPSSNGPTFLRSPPNIRTRTWRRCCALSPAWRQPIPTRCWFFAVRTTADCAGSLRVMARLDAVACVRCWRRWALASG